jgi:hypothetical protein
MRQQRGCTPESFMSIQFVHGYTKCDTKQAKSSTTEVFFTVAIDFLENNIMSRCQGR